MVVFDALCGSIDVMASLDLAILASIESISSLISQRVTSYNLRD